MRRGFVVLADFYEQIHGSPGTEIPVMAYAFDWSSGPTVGLARMGEGHEDFKLRAVRGKPRMPQPRPGRQQPPSADRGHRRRWYG